MDRAIRYRPLRDLAAVHGVTDAAIYKAADRGYIPWVPAGAKRNITEGAFRYHSLHGYGPKVPPYPGDADEGPNRVW